MSARQDVLGRIGSALRDVPAEETSDDFAVPRDYRRHREHTEGDVELFSERVADYKATVEQVPSDGVAAAVESALRGARPGVAAAARAYGVPVVAVAGRCLLDGAGLADAGIRAAYALTDIEPDPARCMTEAEPLLQRLSERVAREWSASV